MQDYDSGLRSLMGREWFDRQLYDVYYSYNNFIIGSKLPAQYSFQVKTVFFFDKRFIRYKMTLNNIRNNEKS
jgi:hypothetical protein